MIALTIILGLLFVAYAAFAYRYARYSPWRATYQGVTLEAQKITMALIVAFFIADTLMPAGWPGRFAVLMVLLALLTVEAWATLAGLLYVQNKRGLVTKRQGAGFAHPEDIQKTDPRRITTIDPDKD